MSADDATAKGAEIWLPLDSYLVTPSMTIAPNTEILLLQSVLKFGANSDGGWIVEAVELPWREIARQIQMDPHFMHQISWRKWEEILAGIYKAAGFDEVILTSASGDRGRDVIAIKKGVGSIRVIDQMKAYSKGKLVRANDVRALVGVLEADHASKGFVTTTSDFAPGIAKDPSIQHLVPDRIELVNGGMLAKRLGDFVKK